MMQSANAVSVAPHVRLKRARVLAGYESTTDFAKAVGVNYVTYQHHENGRREMRKEIAHLYERLLNLSAGTLLYGERLSSVDPVSIIASVSKHGKLQLVDTGPDNRQTALLPDPEGLVGFSVSGNDLYPVYRDGDVVFHRELSRNRFSLESLNGLECVVQLPDGSQLLRQLIAQANGRATLLSLLPDPAPAQVDQIVIAAAPIEFVQRKMPSNLFNR